MNLNIGKNLIRIRQEKGLAAKYVAKMLDVDEKNYILWEMGLEQLDVDTILKISEVYGIDYSELLVEKKDSIKEKVEDQNNSGSKRDNKTVKVVTFQKGLGITNLILSLLMLGIFILPIVQIYLYNISGSASFYDFLARGTVECQVLASFMLIIICLFIIDYIIKLSSDKIATGTYGKVSNILKAVMLGVFTICYIVFMSLILGGGYGNIYISWGTVVQVIYVAALLVLEIITIIFDLKKKVKNK